MWSTRTASPSRAAESRPPRPSCTWRSTARGPISAAVVHTHSLFASVAAVAGMEIPPILDEMATTLVAPVRVSEYGFPGSAELADKVALALGDRAAALIRNHGAVGVGGSPQEALEVCTLLERAAQIFVYASLLGKATPYPGLHRGRAGHLQDEPTACRGNQPSVPSSCVLVMERGAVDGPWRHS